MSPLPEISFGSVPPLSASQQRIIHQQQLTAMHLQPRQHQLNCVQALQQMNSQQQQPTHLQPGQQQQTNYQQQQQIYYHQQQMYQKQQQSQQQTNYHQQQPTQLQPGQQQQAQQQQPTLLHPGQQQQLNYKLQHGQQQLNYQLPQQWQPTQQQQTKEEMKTLWVGGLQHWMDEAYLHYCFSFPGHVCSVRLIRNKQTGYSEGYGFVEFTSQAAAQRVLLGYNGLSMPHTECQPFRLHWASSKLGQISFRQEEGPEYSLSEGNSATCVTDRGILQQMPQARPEDSLSEGDLAPGVIDDGILQQTPQARPEGLLSEGDLEPGVTDRDRGMPQETPEAGPKCSLLVGDLTPGVTDRGMLREMPKAGPDFSLSAGDLFGKGYPPAKQQLVKPGVDSASPANSAIEQTTEEIASPFNQLFALPDICAEWRNDINKNQLGGFGSFRTDVEFVREE